MQQRRIVIAEGILRLKRQRGREAGRLTRQCRLDPRKDVVGAMQIDKRPLAALLNQRSLRGAHRHLQADQAAGLDLHLSGSPESRARRGPPPVFSHP
ncbi:MAG: hypothetical protein ACK56N_14295 [Betaproteobacteria bacterium]